MTVCGMVTFSIDLRYYRAIFENIAKLSPEENIADPQNGDNIAMLVTLVSSSIQELSAIPPRKLNTRVLFQVSGFLEAMKILFF